MPRLTLARTFIALFLATACGESADVCVGGSILGIDLTVKSAAGVNITATASVVLTRLQGNPAVVVDSAEGPVGATLGRTFDTPGTYRLVVRHEGFVSQEKLVVVPATGNDCAPVVTQEVSVTLVPTT